MASFEIVEPQSLDQAFSMLDRDDPAVRPISGGTALMLMMKSQLFTPVRLVSLRRLGQPFSGFGLSADGTHFCIGAMATFSELEQSPDIKKYFPVVTQTMRTLANVRVRNVATVGGNLAHGDPHLDLPPVWTSLDAQALLVCVDGERVVPVADLFAGYYETNIKDGELIAEIRVPVRPTWRSTYAKVTTRSAHDWPALGIAISIESNDRRITDLRVVLSAALDKPTRLTATEAMLRGLEVDDDVLRRAGGVASEEVHIETDGRGSAAYKRHLLRVHLGRAIQTIVGN